MIRNLENGKVYIGSSNYLNRRWSQHKHILKKNKSSNIHFQKAWNLYGEASFEFNIIEECLPTVLIAREKAWMDNYKSTNPIYGYNYMLPISSGMLGKKHPEEWKREQSKRSKGNKYCVGVKQSEELKKRRSEMNKGKVLSEEHKQKIGNSNKGKIRSEAIKKQWSLAHKGKILSDAHRLNVSNALKNYFNQRRTNGDTIASRN
jgi:group I intron endonuclease